MNTADVLRHWADIYAQRSKGVDKPVGAAYKQVAQELRDDANRIENKSS
jgi:hypothetical protein